MRPSPRTEYETNSRGVWYPKKYCKGEMAGPAAQLAA